MPGFLIFHAVFTLTPLRLSFFPSFIQVSHHPEVLACSPILNARDQTFTMKKGHVSNPRTRVLNYKVPLDKAEQETPHIHRASEKQRTEPRDKENRLRGIVHPGQVTQIHSIYKHV